jgi:HTH-type transcriptional regulator, sugar sensing transcriptional regulator
MKNELRKLGLSDREAEIYLLAIKTGETTANRIAELAKLARSTTYDLLEKLRAKGFIATFIRDKKTYFVANNPDVLLTALEEKERKVLDELNDKRDIMRDLVPKLTKIQNQINDKPLAEVFEGKISVSRVLDEISENAKVLKIIGSQQNAIETIDYKTDKFRAKRKEKKSKTFQILEDSSEARKEKEDKFTEVRFLESLKNSKDAIFIYDDVTVHLILAQEISAIKIKSKEYTNAQKIVFDELWNKAKR